MNFLLIRRALCAALVLTAPILATAQTSDYPSRTLTLVIPYPPGGTTDIVGRIVAQKLGDLLGQSVIVENRSGAGGTVGTGYVARQPADGYTLVMGNIGPISVSPTLYPDLAYDPLKDLRAVRNLIGIPNAIIVRADSPLKSIQYLLARKGKEPLAYATPGPTTSPHLTAERFALESGVPLLHVPYKGSGPAIADVLAGHVPLLIDNLPADMPHLQAGTLRALAVTTDQRLPQLPDVPTLQEAGLKDFVVTGWSGLFVPAGTPDAVVDKLYEAVDKVMHDTQVRARIDATSALMPESSPAQFRAFVEDETGRWRTVVQTAGIKLQ